MIGQQHALDAARTDAQPAETAGAPLSAVHAAGGGENLAGAPLRRRTPSPPAVLLVASIAVFMAFLDDTVVSIAFPNMLRSFRGSTIGELSWVFNAYNIAFAAMLLPAGRIADLVGRRRLFVLGLYVFTVASALCAIAPTPAVLIAARALQGIGAATVVPASLALVLHAHSPERRAGAVGVWSGTAALAAGIGPTVGGVLVFAYDWRLVFLVNVPVGVLAHRLAARNIVESRAAGAREVPDLVGVPILAACVSALALAVAEGPTWGWTSPGVIVSAAAALALGVAFARRCATQRAPILDMELLRTPGFVLLSVVTLVGSAGFLALGIANVLFLTQVWHYSPLTAGFALTPAPFVAAPAAVLAGLIAQRRDARILVALGALVLAAGAAWLVLRMGSRPDYLGEYLPAAVLVAIGIGLAFPLVSDAAVSNAPHGRFAGATSMSTALRLVGGALGVALLASFLAHAGPGSLHPFRQAWGFAGVCFAALAAAAAALPRFTPAARGESLLAAVPARVQLAPACAATAPRRAARPPARHVPVTAEELLASVALFAALPPEILRTIAQGMTTVHCRPGEWLFRQGDEADAMYVLRSGRLEVFREAHGAEREQIRELGAGSAVGELALLSGKRRSASVRARRNAELLRLSGERFAELLDSTPSFAAGVSRSLAAELRRSSVLDAEPVARASTIAVLAADPTAASCDAQALLRRELVALRRVACIDHERVSELHPGSEPGAALARTLDRLEQDHEIVLITATGEEAWQRACVEQADRVVLLVAEARDGAPVVPANGRCDVVLLCAAAQEGVRALLDRLQPRSTQRVRRECLQADIARLARRLAGCAVGLVLSGGGARAFAHLGVIDVLEQAGVVVDRVGGASMGAFIGALLARGLDAAAIDAHCYEEWVWRNPLSDYGLPRHALYRGGRLRATIERTLPGCFEDLPLPYYNTAVDIVSNEQVVQRRGDLPSAVTASMAVPGVLPPVIRENRLLFDGAVLDGLPVSIMAEQREGPIIACDVTERGLRELPHDGQPRLPTLLNTLANMAFLTTSDTREQADRHADLVILPDHESVGALEFHMLDSLRAAGRRAALAALQSPAAGSLR
jgi:NTE family protein